MCHRNCHRSIKEKELSQKAKSLFVEGLEISPNLGTEKIHRLIYFYINKSPHNICFSFSKALSIMKVFSLAIHDSTQPDHSKISQLRFFFLNRARKKNYKGNRVYV